MHFMELHHFKTGEAILVNIESIVAVEDNPQAVCINLGGGAVYYVSESYADIVALLRDALGAVV